MGDAVQWTVIGKWMPQLVEASILTLKITAMSFVVAVLIGALVGIIRHETKYLGKLFALYVELFRGTPLLVQLFFLYYGLAQVGVAMPAMVAAVVGLGLNSGAYISEIVRGSLNGVDRGQYHAARALGMTRIATLIWVVLPQALNTAVPPLVNSFASMLKDTSLVSLLAITELMNIANQIYSRTFRAFEIYAVIAGIYLALTLVFSLGSRFLEKRLQQPR